MSRTLKFTFNLGCRGKRGLSQALHDASFLKDRKLIILSYKTIKTLLITFFIFLLIHNKHDDKKKD